MDARATSVPTVVARPWERRSEKVQSWQRDRLALVYVRQSTPQQVHDHQESTRLQYGLTGRAQDLGWAAERVVVIDDDLGKSGASADGRPGFQRLVTEVSLDHVGIILGVEMSRLARSGKDWHQLLELCALFRTLIADLDGVYDPAEYNDRLLLGLKGTMSEAELHLLKQRMHQGRLNKARRGELAIPVPTGYLRRPSGEVTFDPDEQVQAVVRLIFGQFAELGTLSAVLRYLVRHEIQLGIRVRAGPGTGDLEWHRPNRMTLQNLLRNPIYAGAYAYGRRQVDPRRQRPGRPSSGRRVIDPEGWLVLLPDRLPAYITWEQYERNLARLRANQARADAIGAVRSGPSLLAGLVVCGRCGHRMTVRYSGVVTRHNYLCGRVATDYGGAWCQHLAGPCLDRFVSQQVLTALEPAALELSLAAASQVEQERAALDRLWQQRLERAAYEAERAERQYQVAEPENRLVVRQLERTWEEKLVARQQLDEAYHRFAREQPRLLSPTEQATIRRLAADIPALWDAPTTTDADRKAIIRQIVAQVTVAVQGESERVQVTITWAGGVQTAGELVRPVARVDQLSYYPRLVERVRALAAEGLSMAAIAARLNAEGFRPPKRRERFGPQGVHDLLQRLENRTPRRRSEQPVDLGVHEWWLADLARATGMPPVTLFSWIRRGWVTGRQQAEPPRRWILWADEAELEQLRERHRRPISYYTRHPWVAAP
ncbi:MAG: recombinase family protein [Sporichthyaceae bacterium]|nr:recombinase family protein [Sporichthyaceae bacterium]